MCDVNDRIARLDISLFEEVEAQLEPDDRRSLLALHAACRAVFGKFDYLEIGSHLGGSLQTFIRDPACRSIVSIDPRPQRQPDESGVTFTYEDNATTRMLTALARIPGAEIDKLHTIEQSTEQLTPADLTTRPQLALIDGEHTHRAALRDARFCTAVMDGEGCIAFHDTHVIYQAIDCFLQELSDAGQPFHAVALPRSIFIVELGQPRLSTCEPLKSIVDESYKVHLQVLAETAPYRAEYRRTGHRILRRLERLTAEVARRRTRNNQP
jgi:hypothetical protein